jgi:hypothetical protein
VISDASLVPPDACCFAIQHHIVHREFGDGVRHGRIRGVLRQPVARQEPNVGTVLEREETNAIELSLEEPFRPGEALLGKRGGHRLEPVRKGHGRITSECERCSQR